MMKMFEKWLYLCTIPTLYLEGDPVAVAVCAYWLIGLLCPTTEVGLRRTRGELLENERKYNNHQIRTLSSSFSSNVRNEVTYFSEGRRGKTFHWSSSLSKWRRFMILFFSSGGMKFSMIRFLVKNIKGQMTKPSCNVQEFCLFIAYFRIKPWGHVGLTWISSLLSARSLSAPVPASLWHVHWWYLQSQTSPAAAYCKTKMNKQCGVDYCKNKTKI